MSATESVGRKSTTVVVKHCKCVRGLIKSNAVRSSRRFSVQSLRADSSPRRGNFSGVDMRVHVKGEGHTHTLQTYVTR
ncbi:hypothetical protein QQ045_020014 [Rhodiola kirilowii]